MEITMLKILNLKVILKIIILILRNQNKNKSKFWSRDFKIGKNRTPNYWTTDLNWLGTYFFCVPNYHQNEWNAPKCLQQES